METPGLAGLFGSDKILFIYRFICRSDTQTSGWKWKFPLCFQSFSFQLQVNFQGKLGLHLPPFGIPNAGAEHKTGRSKVPLLSLAQLTCLASIKYVFPYLYFPSEIVYIYFPYTKHPYSAHTCTPSPLVWIFPAITVQAFGKTR